MTTTPKVAFFVYSDAIQMQPTDPPMPGYNGGQRHVIVGAQMMFQPIFIPCQYSFAISVGLSGFEPAQSYRLRFQFRKQGLQTIISDSGDHEIDISDLAADAQDAEDIQLVVGAQLANVIIEDEGWYETELFINSDSVGVYPIKIRKADRHVTED
jgi:hypothetical protein